MRRSYIIVIGLVALLSSSQALATTARSVTAYVESDISVTSRAWNTRVDVEDFGTSAARLRLTNMQSSVQTVAECSSGCASISSFDKEPGFALMLALMLLAAWLFCRPQRTRWDLADKRKRLQRL